MKMIYISCVIR